MAKLYTPKGEMGSVAPDFKLLATDGNFYSLEQLKGVSGTVVMFICNHCPYVQAIITRLVETMEKLKTQGINGIAIMSNDVISYPDDSFENMQKFAKLHNISFPYLIDEDQTIAKEYRAVCTPDFFGYDKNLELKYRGRLDSAGMNKDAEIKEHELLQAMFLIAKTGKGPELQNPSVGCSIKWRANLDE